MGIHVVDHFLGHGVTILARDRDTIDTGHPHSRAAVAVGLGLSGLVEQLGNELLLILRRGDGIHLVHGLGLGGPGQFQLQLGEHQLQARGGAQLTE